MQLQTSTKNRQIATVIVDLGIERSLDYEIPEELLPNILPGVTVEVPIQGRTRRGVVQEIKEKSAFKSLKPISRLLSHEVKLTDELFSLAVWMSRYYCTPLGKVIKSLLPSFARDDTKHQTQAFITRAKSKEELRALCEKLRQKNPKQAAVLDPMLKVPKGLFLTELIEQTGLSKSPIASLIKKGYLKSTQVKIDRSPLEGQEYFKTAPKKLNDEQAKAFKTIEKSLTEQIFQTHLLYGITGSGKTEVYLQAIRKARQQNLGVIILVPEIALTIQTVERFKSRFDEPIAILHHRLSKGERFDAWHKILRGEVKIVIGARSAIFSPIQNLGLIIVDEEHDSSYKQSEEMPCYNARDIAVKRGSATNSTVILGSATPSLESYKNAATNKYTLLTLSKRADVAQLPNVHLLDMRPEYEKADGSLLFAPLLLDKIKERYEKGEQTILFLNRRGFAASLICKTCGQAVKCNHCDITLTFHKKERELRCHLCGATSAPIATCPSCHAGDTMRHQGFGTERVERTLCAILPNVRTLRLDADTTRHKGALQKQLRHFGTGKADVLIGTQMVAKGHHFPSVTLVGILNTDATLNLPDFRSQETVFQLTTQVAGRAGRGEIKGEVIIQTASPDHPTLQFAKTQDYLSFYTEEIKAREIFDYPPFTALTKLTFSGKNEETAFHAADKFRLELLKKLPKEVQVHPVIPSVYAKIKDNYRFQFLLKGKNPYQISCAIAATKVTAKLPSNIKLLIDMNPLSMG